FGPGSYKLTTENLPILTKIMGWKYGFDSPFKAEVYFVNTKQFPDQKWGTTNPVMLRDKEFGMIRLRGHGKYSFRVEDPALFLKEIFGTNKSYEVSAISDYIKSLLVQNVADTIGELKIAAIDLATQYNEIAEELTRLLNVKLQEMGLSMVNVVIENLSLPQEVEEAMDKRTSVGVMGDVMGDYMRYEAAGAMRDAARNEGGGLAGAGVGMGAGLGMGALFADAMRSGMGGAGAGGAGGAVCGKCGEALVAGAKFCGKCGTPVGAGAPCSKCGKPVPAGSKFCPDCGTPVARNCSKCGKALPAGSKFCPDCGTPV
ncbi:MAG: SPFH domain-containing protein, partial [Clostridia bacterium]|nr:SPFH domain-containing protein [Clostridia bacterium]